MTRPEAETPVYPRAADDMAALVKMLEAYRQSLEAADSLRRHLSRGLKGMGRPALCDGERGFEDAMAEVEHETVGPVADDSRARTAATAEAPRRSARVAGARPCSGASRPRRR